MSDIVKYAREHKDDIPALGEPFHVANHDEWTEHSGSYLETGVPYDGWKGYEELMVQNRTGSAKKRGRTRSKPKASKSNAGVPFACPGVISGQHVALCQHLFRSVDNSEVES